MGYGETLCQLCGVSFAIARHRRPDEPESAAWDFTGSYFIDQGEGFEVDERCGDATGCKLLARDDDRNRGRQDPEHIAGFHCVSVSEYSGWRISVEEMKGCRAVQALVKKDSGWTPEPDDQDFELEGNYFLTGIGDGSPDGPLAIMESVRHGVTCVCISNCLYMDDDNGLPFHPTCFEIFKKISERRYGRVDMEGLWYWRELEPDFEDFFVRGPHDFAARSANEQWLLHEPGCEYLAANPIEVPGLAKLVEPSEWGSDHKTTFSWRYEQPEEICTSLHRMPPSKAETGPDPFGNLSAEISDMILEKLGSKDIANLRLASRMFRQLPHLLFRRLLLEDIPWI